LLPIAGIPLSLNELADELSGAFSHPSQVEHFKELLAGLIVSDNRTVAGIHQRLIDGEGYDALRKFLSRSPWTAEQLQHERLDWIAKKLPIERESPNVVAIDPTFVHHTGENIYGVYRLRSDNMNVRLASPCCTTPKITSAGLQPTAATE